MQTQKIEYQDGKTILEGYFVVDTKKSGKKPGVLVAHDWSGRNEFACQKAEALAKLGYAAFALDMFGKGVIGETNEEKTKLIQPLLQDRAHLLKRMQLALDTLQNLEGVDSACLGAIGFCFGGLCVLDLARSGAKLSGVVSFHGILNPPESAPQGTLHAKILALHGHDDPMVPPEQVLAFEQEMTAAKADWQMHIFGNTKHAFTNPQAHDHTLGTVYEKKADMRSWVLMQQFLEEIFECSQKV